MKVFSLSADISVNVDKALKNISKVGEAAENLDGTLTKSTSKWSKIGNVLGKVGSGFLKVGKVAATGIGIASTAIGGLTVKALNMAGELEQNMGGSEAVFGKYANKMQETAKKAFSNMGLSTSDYLATANKMGALFQGAGFDIEESMTLSQDAMQRAADVASIMGIDTASAMEAVAGAAKGNFTMMDNLGVAMNETTLANYALEKGMKKSYKEMTQQEKIGLAMEMFLDKTSYAAGNYAKENETLAGSLSTAKAALSNFLSGAGSADDVVSSLTKTGEVITKNLVDLFPKLMTGLTQIVTGLVPMIPKLLNELLPSLIQGATSLINGLVSAMPQIIGALMSAVPSLIEGIIQIMNAIIAALPQIVSVLVGALPSLIPQLINGLISMIVTLCANLVQIIQPIIDALPTIIMSVIEALLNNLPILIEGVIQLVLGLVNALPEIINTLVEATPTIMNMIIDGLINALPLLIEGVIQLVKGIVQALPQILSSITKALVQGMTLGFNAIKRVFAPLGNWFGEKFKEGKENATRAWDNVKSGFSKAWSNVKSAFSNVGGWFKDQFKQGKDNATQAWSNVKTFFSNVWNGIKNVFKSVASWFKEQFAKGWNNVKTAWNAAKTFFSNIWSGIKNIFSNVGSWFRTKFVNAWNNIKNAWSGVKSFFSNIKNGIVNAFSNVKEKLTQPFNKARDAIKKVADKIKGFFKGEIKMPKVKVPKFSIKPSGWKVGDLLEGKIPKLGITWAAKGGIYDQPTLFNTPTGTLGVGEAGAEAVAPIDVLMGYVSQAVDNKTRGLNEGIENLYNIMAKFLPIIADKNYQMVLDSGALVGELTPAFDTALGERASGRERGR